MRKATIIKVGEKTFVVGKELSDTDRLFIELCFEKSTSFEEVELAEVNDLALSGMIDKVEALQKRNKELVKFIEESAAEIVGLREAIKESAEEIVRARDEIASKKACEQAL